MWPISVQCRVLQASMAGSHEHFVRRTSATQPVLALRLKLSGVSGHALMLHAGGDNHSDHPAPLGGGGAQIACGVMPAA